MSQGRFTFNRNPSNAPSVLRAEEPEGPNEMRSHDPKKDMSGNCRQLTRLFAEAMISARGVCQPWDHTYTLRLFMFAFGLSR